MKKLLIATTNPAKLTDIKKGLQPLIEKGIEIVSLKDLNITDEPEETGATFEENSELKAKYYAEKSGLPAIADDGGLTIDALNGEPGVKSRRWPGYAASDEELIKYALEKLKNIPTEKRTARIQTCICYYNPETKRTIMINEGIEGIMSEKPQRYTPGYPYRALFIVTEYNKFYDDLTEEEQQNTNHRFKALRRLTQQIENDLVE